MLYFVSNNLKSSISENVKSNSSLTVSQHSFNEALTRLRRIISFSRSCGAGADGKTGRFFTIAELSVLNQLTDRKAMRMSMRIPEWAVRLRNKLCETLST